MRRRLTIDKDGLLRDSNGAAVGKLVSMVVEFGDVEEEGGAMGGEKVSSQTPSLFSSDVVGKPAPQGGVGGSTLETVWAHYQRVIHEHGSQKLDSTRRTIIQNALRVRTAQECCEAIDGLRVSPHHNGVNPAKKQYLGIRYALKGNVRDGESNDERIDKMRAKANPTVSGILADIPTAGHAMVRDRMRKVEQALLQPDDASLRTRAGDSAEYLGKTFGLHATVAEGKVVWARGERT